MSHAARHGSDEDGSGSGSGLADDDLESGLVDETAATIPSGSAAAAASAHRADYYSSGRRSTRKKKRAGAAGAAAGGSHGGGRRSGKGAAGSHKTHGGEPRVTWKTLFLGLIVLCSVMFLVFTMAIRSPKDTTPVKKPDIRVAPVVNVPDKTPVRNENKDVGKVESSNLQAEDNVKDDIDEEIRKQMDEQVKTQEHPQVTPPSSKQEPPAKEEQPDTEEEKEQQPPEETPEEKPAKTSLSCPHSAGRNYYKQPVVFQKGISQQQINMSACDIPCIIVSEAKVFGYIDGTMTRLPGSNPAHSPESCDHVQKIIFSMESAVQYPICELESARRNFDIVATYDLDSDVPAPYFSWAEYDFMSPVVPKTAKSMAVALISNCHAMNNRLQYLSALMDAGVTVDSFGSCLKNAEFPSTLHTGNYFDEKIALTRNYKFAIAFENSNTKDYVTEKLFATFVAGAVPIHMGIEDVHRFGPSPHSIISVHDFVSPQSLAAYLKMLDKNDTMYQEYLSWKVKGYSKEFKALVDIANVHSSCRLCIKIADNQRAMYGEPQIPSKYKSYLDLDTVPSERDYLRFKARSRGTFWFYKLHMPLSDFTYPTLVSRLTQFLPHPPNTDVWEITTAANRTNKLTNDADLLRVLHEGAELEVYFV
ncbi:glycoprotein 3-alpha-L-fucosyltransferase A [Pelomyxa schiedti]|nr:glycoprotein 3-alpha-L-fucosyltransferase A [Pelomyxa schiedti]